jgi:catechol 2,3-dioxygenase-like lactoylglutathione lyase family enzyme
MRAPGGRSLWSPSPNIALATKLLCAAGPGDIVAGAGRYGWAMLTFGNLVIGVSDAERAAAFWCSALGFSRRPAKRDDEWVVLDPPPGSPGPAIALDVSETPVQDHPRLHVDLLARDETDLAKEVGRLLSLGARRVDWDGYPSGEPGYVVLADTENNIFCVGYPK